MEENLQGRPFGVHFFGAIEGRIKFVWFAGWKGMHENSAKGFAEIGIRHNRNSNDETSQERGETDESRTVHKIQRGTVGSVG
ncbi:MAG: hypothetical protein ACLVDB_07050 [Anaeromassilibacillus sp.]